MFLEFADSLNFKAIYLLAWKGWTQPIAYFVE
jgi:hypothetical protein